MYGRILIVSTDKEGNIETLSGTYIPDISLDINPIINEETTILNFQTLNNYEEDIISNGLAIYFISNEKPELVWDLDTILERYFISAKDGEIIAGHSKIYYLAQPIPASGLDLDGNLVEFDVQYDSSEYLMDDPIRRTAIRDINHSKIPIIYTAKQFPLVTSIDNVWSNQVAVTAISNLTYCAI